MFPPFRILPSLLAADYGSLASEILRAQNAGADAIHLDIMDGHFVPNISFGPAVVSLAAKTAPGFHRNVHLMLTQPNRYVDVFAKAGADTLQIHVEAQCNVKDTLRAIRSAGMRAGLVLNPRTESGAALPYIEDGLVDELLYMSVYPGFGGQSFMDTPLPNIRFLRARYPELEIMIDGGINRQTLPLAAQAGCNAFVAGSALFKQPDMQAEIAAYRNLLEHL